MGDTRRIGVVDDQGEVLGVAVVVDVFVGVEEGEGESRAQEGIDMGTAGLGMDREILKDELVNILLH